MATKRTCEACGKLRVLRRIDSGQMLCRTCLREMKPVRAPGLIPWATLDAYYAKGIELPWETTPQTLAAFERNMNDVVHVLQNVWFALLGHGYKVSGVDRGELELVAFRLLQNASVAEKVLVLERQRNEEAAQRYQHALATAREQRERPAPSVYFLDEQDRLCVDEVSARSTVSSNLITVTSTLTKSVDVWYFKPPLPHDRLFRELISALHQQFPAQIPRA